MNYFKVLILTLTALGVNAQTGLHVGDNTYMFVKDQYVYVTSDVDIKSSTSNIYLRNDGQLLQGTTGAGANKGTGNLSVYQEGTVNNFQYNYWCSPVGNNTSSSVNNPFSISQLKDVTGLTTFNNPVLTTSLDGLSAPLTISQRWIYTFSTSNTYSQWFYAGAGNINPGLGFTMKGTNGGNQRYDFRGKPNDGTMTQAVTANNFTLVGNPYPSAIDIDLFLSAANNPSIDGNAYYWEQVVKNSHLIAVYEGGYGSYNATTGYTAADIWNYTGSGAYNTDISPIPPGTSNLHKRFVPIGQGFMVKGNGVAPNTVSMKNSFRVYRKETDTNSTSLARNAQPVDPSSENEEYYEAIPNVAGIDYTKIKVNNYVPLINVVATVNDQGRINTALGFGNEYSDSFDRAADTETANASDSNYNFYHILKDSDKEYRVSVSKFNKNKTYPIGVRTKEKATFKFKATNFLNGFDSNQAVYIHDKTDDTYHKINTEIYEVALEAGNYKDRFEITFKDGKKQNDIKLTSDLVVFQNNSNGMLTINNPQALQINTVILYDITGKEVITKSNLGNNSTYEFNTTNISDGVYIVKLNVLGQEEISKKVIVTNKK